MSAARRSPGPFIALLLTFTAASPASAALGGLDPSFGDGGIVRLPPDTDNCRYPRPILDIGLGAAGAIAGSYEGTVRLEPSGALNPNFGERSGPPAACPVGPGAAAVREQGSRLIAFGGSIARLSRNGIVDRSFGKDGRVGFAGEEFADGAVDLDERIVAAGVTRFDHASPVFERLLPDGKRDPSFGFDGVARLRTPFERGATIEAVAVQPDGGVVGVGQATNRRGEFQVYIVRLRPDGVRDRRFGTSGNGIVQIHLGEYSLGIGVAVEGERIYVLGTTEGVRSESEVILAGLRPDGRFDRSFGRDGLVRQPVYDMQPTALALYHGMAVVSGWAGRRRYGGHRATMVLTRFTRQGLIDRSFGHGGVVRTAVGKEAFAEAVAVRHDGKILIGGVANVGKTRVPIIARYFGHEGRH